MLSDQSKRLIAGVLLILLLGWAVRWWRGHVVVDHVAPVALPSVEQSVTPSTTDIDQPRD